MQRRSRVDARVRVSEYSLGTKLTPNKCELLCSFYYLILRAAYFHHIGSPESRTNGLL